MTIKHLIFDFDGVIGDTWETLVCAHLRNGSAGSRDEALMEMEKYFNRITNHTRNHTQTEEELKRQKIMTIELGRNMFECGVNLFDTFIQEIESIEHDHKAIVSSGSLIYISDALKQTKINPTHILAYEDHHSKEEKIEKIVRDWAVSIDDV